MDAKRRAREIENARLRTTVLELRATVELQRATVEELTARLKASQQKQQATQRAMEAAQREGSGRRQRSAKPTLLPPRRRSRPARKAGGTAATNIARRPLPSRSTNATRPRCRTAARIAAVGTWKKRTGAEAQAILTSLLATLHDS
jgi:hypothetical protein